MATDSEPSPHGGSPFDDQPTRALLLAQALEACIQAERDNPGSADRLIAHQPAWARGELRRLVSLANALDAVATNAIMSEDFRVAARQRLMQRVAHGPVGPSATSGNGHAATPSLNGYVVSVPSRNGHHGGHVRVRSRRHALWLRRGGTGGLLAAVLIGAATLTASANALPGEPLYSVKQAGEELGVRLAPDDQARSLALLGQADARLDETARLLRQGRTDAVAQTTQRYDETLSRALTMAVTVTGSSPDPLTSTTVQSRLDEQQQQLQSMLATAPEPARDDIRQAIVATERSRALVASPRPAQAAPITLQVTVAEALPTTPPAPEPTTAPTGAPRLASVKSLPPVDVLTGERAARVGRARPEPDEGVTEAVTEQVTEGVSPRAAVTGRGQSSRSAAPAQRVEQPAVDRGDDNRGDDRTAREVRLPITPPVHVVAPAANQNDNRDPVAEEPAAPVGVARNGRGSQDNSRGDDPSRAMNLSTTQASQTSPDAPASAVARTQPTAAAASSDDRHNADGRPNNPETRTGGGESRSSDSGSNSKSKDASGDGRGHGRQGP